MAAAGTTARGSAALARIRALWTNRGPRATRPAGRQPGAGPEGSPQKRKGGENPALAIRTGAARSGGLAATQGGEATQGAEKQEACGGDGNGGDVDPHHEVIEVAVTRRDVVEVHES